MDLNYLIQLLFITCIPGLELRASIPYALVFLKEDIFQSLFFIILVNIFLGWILYILLDLFLKYLLRIKIFEEYYNKKIKSLQRKAKPLLEKYGFIGMAVFIGIPFPGSGVYSGAFLAHFLGMRKRKFFLAESLGVFIAALIIAFISLFLR